MRVIDEDAIDVHPRMRPQHMHDRAAVKQVKIVEAEKEVRIVRDDPVELRFRGEPFPDVNAVSDDEALVPDSPEAVISVSERLEHHGMHVADERILREMAIRHVRLVLCEDIQHAVSRYELRKNPALHRGRPVDHAEDLVPRRQALRDVIDDDIVQYIPAAAVEGAYVIAREEP